LEKRKGKKAAAEKYEPIKGHFPGADFPLAVAQIDHTPRLTFHKTSRTSWATCNEK
jgi:hypothetical protein